MKWFENLFKDNKEIQKETVVTVEEIEEEIVETEEIINFNIVGTMSIDFLDVRETEEYKKEVKEYDKNIAKSTYSFPSMYYKKPYPFYASLNLILTANDIPIIFEIRYELSQIETRAYEVLAELINSIDNGGSYMEDIKKKVAIKIIEHYEKLNVERIKEMIKNKENINLNFNVEINKENLK